jgi:hypothetical protein
LGLQPTHARVLPKGSIEARLDVAYSNVFEQGRSATNRLNLDMELMRAAFHVLYGLRDDLEFGVELPLYHTGGGFLDGFIQSFHKFFHLPNGGRDQIPDNQYNYRFFSGGNPIYDVPSQTLMLGDVAFRLKYRVAPDVSWQPGVAVFADLKLPTGSRSRGTGNNAVDFGIGLALEKSYKRVHGYLDMEYIVSGADGPLEDFMRNQMFAFATAVEITILDTWSAIVQLAGSTPLLTDAGFDSWDGVPMDLIVGFRGEEKGLIGGNDLIWQAGFSEDVLSSGPSVDFTAFFSLGVRFHPSKKVFNKDEWQARKPFGKR